MFYVFAYLRVCLFIYNIYNMFRSVVLYLQVNM
jgi:hypothetical protein